ncbi:hypothetical protein SNEBB_003405 [Seison nebaliae]|nr:hypothetical protein SNEBB_003405 [Seison nebaliae]
MSILSPIPTTSRNEDVEIEDIKLLFNGNENENNNSIFPSYYPIKLPKFSNPDLLYATKNVGRQLTQAVTDLLKLRPQDPISFLAQKLRFYHNDYRYKQEVARRIALLELEMRVRGQNAVVTAKSKTLYDAAMWEKKAADVSRKLVDSIIKSAIQRIGQEYDQTTDTSQWVENLNNQNAQNIFQQLHLSSNINYNYMSSAEHMPPKMRRDLTLNNAESYKLRERIPLGKPEMTEDDSSEYIGYTHGIIPTAVEVKEWSEMKKKEDEHQKLPISLKMKEDEVYDSFERNKYEIQLRNAMKAVERENILNKLKHF